MAIERTKYTVIAKGADFELRQDESHIVAETIVEGDHEDMLRLGLCCKFLQEPINFRTTTATALLKLDRLAALQKVSQICLANTTALQQALAYCAAHQIGGFRVNSQILPVKTHPTAGYDMSELPDAPEIIAQFQACGDFARQHNLRLSFHPDQFVVLSSPTPEIVERAIADIAYHTQVADWIGADVINIHAGGVYGDKPTALHRLAKNLRRLSDCARRKVTLENDDRSYTPSDLLPFCRAEEVPLVYDVHHHRCLPDGQSVAAITDAACATWNREPLFHLSSPIAGWDGPKPTRHHAYIDIRDFPDAWRTIPLTVEVEAKAKELAVLKLSQELHLKDR